MKKTTILLYHSYLDNTIKKLHEKGLMEITKITKEEAETLGELDTAPIHPEAIMCQEYVQRLSKIVSILKQAKIKTNGIKAILNPELPEIQHIDDVHPDELYSDIEGVLSTIEKTILKDDHRLQQIKDELAQIHEHIENITKIKQFDIKLSSITSSQSLIIKAGLTTDIAQLKEALKPYEKSVLYSKQLIKGKKALWSVIIAGHILERKTIERIYSEHITELDLPLIDKKPKEAIKHLKEQKKSLITEKKEIQLNLRKLSSEHLNTLLGIKEQIQLESLRKDISKQFAQTESTILIKGWVLADNAKTLEKTIQESTNNHAIITLEDPSTNPDNPPTYFKAPGWAQSFKTLLELFAVPKYNEINPTIIMGIFFVLFFGMMLGDAGYGTILMILSLIGFIKFGKYSPTIKNWSFMGIWLGLVTTIVGFLTYSIFGNLIHMTLLGDTTTELLYQFSLLGTQFPIDSLKDPISILTMALILGILHLNIGIILGIYQAFKRKQFKEMMTEKLCWIPLQIGGGMLIGKFILDWSISQPLFYVAGALVAIGIIQLLYANGPVGFFDITGYVGDWLSYARLLALGLATAGMALAFNVVSKLLGEMIPFVGIIITILLLVILHVVNLAISALGAGVHSLRLQYVEFFNRFYEGGGHEFSPFKIKRTYTQIKEDKNT